MYTYIYIYRNMYYIELTYHIELLKNLVTNMKITYIFQVLICRFPKQKLISLSV